MADATLKQVREFFDMPIKDFTDSWKIMSDKDKAELKQGIGDGTLNY